MEHERKLADINTKDIIVDENGQRNVEERKTEYRRIMRDFNPDLVDPINVAFVDGKYYCYDGQMRIKVLKAKNGGKDVIVKAFVIFGLTLQDVAGLFLKKNDPKNQVATSLYDRIRVAANYGGEDEKRFIDIVKQNGFKLSRDNSGAIYIAATKALWDEYKIFDDKDEFSETLYILHEAFAMQNNGTNCKIIHAVGLFVRTYKGQYKLGDVTSTFRKVPAVDIIIQAEGGRKQHKTSDYTEVMVDFYNKHRTTNRIDVKLLWGAK